MILFSAFFQLTCQGSIKGSQENFLGAVVPTVKNWCDPFSLQMNFPLQLQKFETGEQEIQLFVPDVEAVKEAYKRGEIAFPYWSQVWPAAKALARFLASYPTFTAAKKVVELGAGLGFPSFVAAQNAAAVYCTDYAPEAVEIVWRSARHNGVKNVSAAVVDWRHLPPQLEADVLLLSDINYEPQAFAQLLRVIKSFLEKGTLILLSTPQRLMAKDFIAPLLSFCIQQEEVVVLHEGASVLTTVMVLQKK